MPFRPHSRLSPATLSPATWPPYPGRYHCTSVSLHWYYEPLKHLTCLTSKIAKTPLHMRDNKHHRLKKKWTSRPSLMASAPASTTLLTSAASSLFLYVSLTSPYPTSWAPWESCLRRRYTFSRTLQAGAVALLISSSLFRYVSSRQNRQKGSLYYLIWFASFRRVSEGGLDTNIISLYDV